MVTHNSRCAFLEQCKKRKERKNVSGMSILQKKAAYKVYVYIVYYLIFKIAIGYQPKPSHTLLLKLVASPCKNVRQRQKFVLDFEGIDLVRMQFFGHL